MFQDTHMRRVAVVVGIAAIAALFAYTYYAIVQARYANQPPTVITVRGEGEVFATPDIATVSFSVMAEKSDAAAAKNESAEKVNAILSYLEEQQIDMEKDVKTDYYNLSPKYEYPQVICPDFGYCPPGKEKLIGYTVTQTISVKIRNEDAVGTIISGIAERGATNLNGPSFTIDDESELKAQARELAIEDAKEKAAKLTEELGVRIVRINGYWEEEGYMPYYGMGGGAELKAMDAAQSVTPDIPRGENTITSRVNISYEIR